MTPEAIRALLEKVEPFSLLPPEELRGLAARCALRRYAARETIFAAQSPIENVWALASGLVSITTSHEEERVILNIQKPGDLFGCVGLVCERLHSLDAWALTDCQVVGVPVARYKSLLEIRPALSGRVSRILAERLRESNRLRAILRQPAERRLSLILSWLHGKLGGEIPLTRELLAEIGAMRTETAIRVLSPLEKKGWISTRRGRIRILAPERL